MNSMIIVTPSLDPKHNVSGISSVAKFIIDNNKEYNYIPFIQGKKDNEKGGLHRITRLIKAYANWKSFLNQHHGYLIHYNFPLDAKSVLRDYFFMRYARKKNFKMVAHVHGGLYMNKTDKPKIIEKMMRQIFTWNIQFIVLSEGEKDILKKQYNAHEVHVLPNCVDLTDASTFDRKPSDKIDALYLGRIETNKGIDYILEAFTVLKNDGVEFTLHFAGKENIGTNYVEKFSKELGDKFIYEGVVYGEQKNELLRKCNVFVMPSFFEGLPMSLLECMSYSMVPVVTNVGSICSVVKNGENGLFVKLKDVDSIVFSIKKLIKEKNFIDRLGNNAKDTIYNDFSPTSYISKLNLVYNELII